MKKLENFFVIFVLTKRVLRASAVSMALYVFAKCVSAVLFHRSNHNAYDAE